MASQDELKAQLKVIMAIPENMTCADCDDKRPTWASLIVPPEGAAFTDPIGCFCCYHCSGAHRRMGTHICFVRSTNLDEWKPKEVEAMKNGGNALVNKLFEALLTRKQAEIVKPDRNTELDQRSQFIYDKYQHRKWFDAKLAQDKSFFAKNAGNSIQEKRVSAGEFDDFFALRTKDAASDSWHATNDDSFDDFNPRGDMKPFPKINSKNSFNNSISALSALEVDPSPAVFSASARGGLSFTRTPKPSGPDGRMNLMKTLQRMDSKREILNTIRNFNIDQDEQIILPHDVVQSDRRKKGRSLKGGEEPLGSADKRRGPTDGDVRTMTRQTVSLHGSESTGSSSRRQAPSRTKSSGSDDGLERPRRRGSDDGDTRPRVARMPSGSEGTGAASRRQLPSRTKSIGSDDGSVKPRRRVQRTSSDDSGAQEQSDVKESSGRPKREPRRGVGRTQSMGADSDHTSPSKGSGVRSRSIKRGVRRTASTDENSLDGSMQSYDADTSQVSARATATRRPPRRPRTPVAGELLNEEEVQPLNDMPSSRRTTGRTDERSRRRSPKKPSNEGSSGSRTPSPSGVPGSTRQRSRTTSGSNDTNPISMRRVATLRDRSPMKNGASPLPTGKRAVPVNLSEDVGRLFASS